MKKTIFAVMTLTLSMASAKTYPVTLYRTAVVAGTVLQPGEYVLDLKNTTAVLKRDKVIVQCPVKVEKVGRKFEIPSIRYAQRDGKNYLQEIRLGGTDLKVVVD
ncbi:MAG: hypothetical protein ABSE56_22435 [Bryobacteraceae bacterium]|jgi:hypothetical protein